MSTSSYVPVREVDAIDGQGGWKEYPLLQEILSTNVEEVGSICFEKTKWTANRYSSFDWELEDKLQEILDLDTKVKTPKFLRPRLKRKPKEIESRLEIHLLLEILTNSEDTPSKEEHGEHAEYCGEKGYCIKKVKLTESGLHINARASCLPVHFWKDARDGNYRATVALSIDGQMRFRCTAKDLIKAIARPEDTETKRSRQQGNETVPGLPTGTKRKLSPEKDNRSPPPKKATTPSHIASTLPNPAPVSTQNGSAPAIPTYVYPIALPSVRGPPERIEQEKDPPDDQFLDEVSLTSLDSLGYKLIQLDGICQLESREWHHSDQSDLFNVKHKPPDTNQSTAEASLAFPSFSLLGRIEQEKDPPDDQFLDEVSLTSLVDSLGSPLCLPNDNIQLESRDCQDGDPNLFNVKHKPPDTNSGLAEEVPDFQFPANTSAQSDFILPDELDDLFIPEDWLLNLSHPNIIDQ